MNHYLIALAFLGHINSSVILWELLGSVLGHALLRLILEISWVFSALAFMLFLIVLYLQEELLLEHFSDLIKFVKTRACKYIATKYFSDDYRFLIWV